MPLLFVPPAISFDNTYFYRPQADHGPSYAPLPAMDPFDRYIAALAYARSAEVEYLQSLQQQRAREAIARRRREELASLLFKSQDGVNRGADNYCQRRSPLHACRCSCDMHRRCDYMPVQLRRQQEVGLKRKQQARDGRQDAGRFMVALYGGNPEENRAKVQLVCYLSTPSSTASHDTSYRKHWQTSSAATRGYLSRDEQEQLEQAFSQSLTQKPAEPEQSSPEVNKNQVEDQSVRVFFLPVLDRLFNPVAQTTEKQSTKMQKASAPSREEHHENMRAVELLDTITALLASLFDPQPASSGAHNQTRPSTEPKQESAKGKDKEAPITINISVPTSKDVAKSLEIVRNVEASFHLLESDFAMPRKLDFTPPPTPTIDSGSQATAAAQVSPCTQLAYSSANAPVHNYTHALSQLLTQLDAVESFGNDQVRSQRREVVSMIERALEGIEGEVEQKGRLSRLQSQVQLAPAEPISSDVEPPSAAAIAEPAEASAPIRITVTDVVSSSSPLDTDLTDGPATTWSLPADLPSDENKKPSSTPDREV